MNWISIDPGVSGTGVAVWPSKYHPEERMLPCKTFSLTYNYKDQYMSDLTKIIGMYRVKECFCENATYFQGDDRGQVTLTSGKLIKLAQFIGGVEEVCRVNNVLITLVSPVKWKGQVPKHVTTRKVLEHWQECPYDPKIYDTKVFGIERNNETLVYDKVQIGVGTIKKVIVEMPNGAMLTVDINLIKKKGI